MCNMEKICHTTSEEMSFENVDRRTPYACIYYKLTYEPTAQVSCGGGGVRVLNPTNSQGHTETGPQFKV